MSPAAERVRDLIAALDLERIEENLFRGRNTEEGFQRLFGGQVIGQALVAASRTVAEDRAPHSLHAYFMREGDIDVPVVYQVERDRDGKSFSTRRVIAIQHGRPIFNLAASFQVPEEGLEHQFEMPAVPDPETLMSDDEWRRQFLDEVPEQHVERFLLERPIDFRRVDPSIPGRSGPRPPHQNIWFRAVVPVPDDPALHRCMLAYASDMTLLSTCQLPHNIAWWDRSMQVASLDHALWFHAPFRVDDWLLYVEDSPRASSARGLNRGLIYRRDGVLVASVAQEGLMRKHAKG
ncbi:acyl-CoA thioesterase II [Sphingosinicella microcystinivorans]|uniref:acyl-CoA thioesterase II n=1 Tax=Sphingosinicella microcystinivorans TaxID=335406 RepID=UPI0022F3EF2A|nr:acyl-CoA thioesterase II [Sphingosinicella microcystinivorans]WBX84479.1 acyl-CoA thioesterase II [Sphingosinicella microcystinivorans]